MVDLKSQYLNIKDEIDQSIQAVLDQTAFIKGPEVKHFEEELGNFLGSKHTISCGNGTDGLQIAMMALGFKSGDEVLVPAFTYIATVEVLALLGIKPVLVDVDRDTFQIKARELEKHITPRTVGIVPVHLFGQCAEMEAIMEIAKRHHLKVIEDAAQSLGAAYTFSTDQKVQSGCIGDIGVTSFFPSKNLGCYGDGGAIFTQDEALAEKIRMIANHGQKRKYYHDGIGVNSRLDTLQAAILRVKLQYLDQYTAKRNEVAVRYNKSFFRHPNVRIPKRMENSSHVYHQYTLRIKDANRDELKAHLSANGIPSMIYYPLPIHFQNAYRDLGYQKGDFPVAESLCEEVISLPIHTEMEPDQQNHIIETLLSYFA